MFPSTQESSDIFYDALDHFDVHSVRRGQSVHISLSSLSENDPLRSTSIDEVIHQQMHRMKDNDRTKSGIVGPGSKRDIVVRFEGPEGATSSGRINVKESFGNFLDSILVARNNHACQRIYRSYAGILKENARQKRLNRFIIHPFSAFRWYWDMVMVVTLIVTLLVMPVEVAFFTSDEQDAEQAKEKSNVWMVINVLVDAIFMIDITFNFRTAYVRPETEEVVFDNKRIIVHYLSTWFLLDILSSVPFDYLYSLTVNTDASGELDDSVYLTLRVLKLTKLLSLLRILRIARLLRYINELEEFMKIEGTIISIAHLIIVTVIFVHWNACVQYLVAFLEGFPETSWVVKFNIHHKNTSMWEKYSFSLYRSIAHMLGMGYGQHTPPTTLVELWIGMICYILGGTFYALFIAHISNMIMSMNLAGKKYEQKVSEVKEYMRFRKVPTDIQRRVLDFYDHMYQRKFFDEQGILFEPNMSPILRNEILMHNCRKLVLKVPFLASAPSEFLHDLICKLRFQVFFPEDIIVKVGRRGRTMYFIEHGSVEVRLPNGHLIKTLTDGDYFGEISLLLDKRRTASVFATEVTDSYMLSKMDFDEVIADHPGVKKILEREAKSRLEEDMTGQRPPSEDSSEDEVETGAFHFTAPMMGSQQTPTPTRRLTRTE